MSIPRHFWRGQHHMMREGWTSGIDDGMTSGLGCSRAERDPPQQPQLYAQSSLTPVLILPLCDVSSGPAVCVT